MFSPLAAILALAAATSASPCAAQSLTLVSLPVVYVRAPIVQAVSRDSRIESRRDVKVPVGEKAKYFARPSQSSLSVSVVTRFQPPVTVDRTPRNYRRGLAQYGPFRVIDARRVALVGETDARTPGEFRAMLREYPDLAQLDMVECPGTRDDRANMELGRLIRAAHLATHVPAFGSVRSGAVELFLAGATRDIAEGAEFAVHSWRDDFGREAADFAPDASENRKYLDYYREMGMDEAAARAFYDFTNSVPHASALWLTANDMRHWVEAGGRKRAAATAHAALPKVPRIDYSDMTFS